MAVPNGTTLQEYADAARCRMHRERESPVRRRAGSDDIH